MTKKLNTIIKAEDINKADMLQDYISKTIMNAYTTYNKILMDKFCDFRVEDYKTWKWDGPSPKFRKYDLAAYVSSDSGVVEKYFKSSGVITCDFTVKNMYQGLLISVDHVEFVPQNRTKTLKLKRPDVSIYNDSSAKLNYIPINFVLSKKSHTVSQIVDAVFIKLQQLFKEIILRHICGYAEDFISINIGSSSKTIDEDTASSIKDIKSAMKKYVSAHSSETIEFADKCIINPLREFLNKAIEELMSIDGSQNLVKITKIDVKKHLAGSYGLRKRCYDAEVWFKFKDPETNELSEYNTTVKAMYDAALTDVPYLTLTCGDHKTLTVLNSRLSDIKYAKQLDKKLINNVIPNLCKPFVVKNALRSIVSNIVSNIIDIF